MKPTGWDWGIPNSASAARPTRNGTVKRPAGRVALPDILKSAVEFKKTMGHVVVIVAFPIRACYLLRMKRLLMISYCGPPNAAVPGKRMAWFARHLQTYQWKPVLLSAHPRYGEISDPFLAEQFPSGAALHHTRSFEPFRTCRLDTVSGLPDYSMNGMKCLGSLALRRLLSSCYPIREPQWGWNRFALRRARQLHRRTPFSAMLVSVPPFSSSQIGPILKRELGLPYVLDYRDPWHQMSNGKITGFVQAPWKSIRLRMHVHLENAAIKEADGIIAASPAIAEQFLERLPSDFHDRITTITNSFDPEIIDGIRPKKETCLTIIHGGSLHGPRIECMLLLHALGELIEEGKTSPDLFQVLLFPGTLPDLQKGRALRGLFRRFPRLEGRVRMMPYFGYERYLEYLKGADLLVLASGVMMQMILAKFFDYLGVNKPVLALAAPGSAMERIMDETGAGWVISPGRTDLLKSALLRCLNGESPIRPSESDARLAYTASVTTKKLAAFLDRVTVGNRR